MKIKENAMTMQRHSEAEPKNPKENKSAVILSFEVGVGISGASAELVVNDGIKTNRYSAKRDLSCCVQALASVTRPLNSITSLSLSLSLSGLRPSSTNNRSNGCLFSFGTHSLRSGFKMTASVFALALILTFGAIGEALAATIDSGTCNYTGTCLWQLDSNYKLTISGSGSMTGYSNKAGVYLDDKNNPRPWEEYIQKISSISVEGTIDNIGGRTFAGATSLLSVNIPDVKILEDYAFNGAVNLTSIFMPKVETIGYATFQNAKKLTSLDIPKLNSIQTFPSGSNLSYINIPESTHIRYFDAETGKYGYRQLTLDDFEHMLENIPCSLSEGHWICGSCGVEFDKSGLGCVADCGVGYLGKEGKCIDSALGCGENYKDMGGWCNRIRYTPAEAAAAMNGDDNTVTITFRK